MWARTRTTVKLAAFLFSVVEVVHSALLRQDQLVGPWHVSPYFIQAFWTALFFATATWLVRQYWSWIMLKISKRRQFAALHADLKYLYDNGRGLPGVLFLDKWKLPPALRDRAIVYDATLSRLGDLGIPIPGPGTQMGVWKDYFHLLMLLSARGLYEKAKKLDVPTEYQGH